jgi:hypothetical protein
MAERIAFAIGDYVRKAEDNSPGRVVGIIHGEGIDTVAVALEGGGLHVEHIVDDGPVRLVQGWLLDEPPS